MFKIIIIILIILSSCNENSNIENHLDILNSLKNEIAELEKKLKHIATIDNHDDLKLKTNNLYDQIKTLYSKMDDLADEIKNYGTKIQINDLSTRLKTLSKKLNSLRQKKESISADQIKLISTMKFQEVEYISWLYGPMKVRVTKPITELDLHYLIGEDYSKEKKIVKILPENLTYILYRLNKCPFYNYYPDDVKLNFIELHLFDHSIGTTIDLLKCYRNKLSKGQSVILAASHELIIHLRQNALLDPYQDEIFFEYRDLYRYLENANTSNIGQYFPSVKKEVNDPTRTIDKQFVLQFFFVLKGDDIIQPFRNISGTVNFEIDNYKVGFRLVEFNMKEIFKYREEEEKTYKDSDLYSNLSKTVGIDMIHIKPGKLDISYNDSFVKKYVGLYICSDCEKDIENHCIQTLKAKDPEYCKSNILEIFKNTKKNIIEIKKNILISAHQVSRADYKKFMGAEYRVSAWESSEEFEKLGNEPLPSDFYQIKLRADGIADLLKKDPFFPYRDKKIKGDNHPATYISEKNLDLFFLKLNKCRTKDYWWDWINEYNLYFKDHEHIKDLLKECKEYKKSKGLIYFRLPTEKEMSYISKMYDIAYRLSDGDIIPRSVHHYFDQGFFYKRIKSENIFSGYINHVERELTNVNTIDYKTAQKIYHISGNAYDIVTTKSGDLLLKGCSVISHINECLPSSSKKYERSYYSGFRIVAELP